MLKILAIVLAALGSAAFAFLWFTQQDEDGIRKAAHR